MSPITESIRPPILSAWLRRCFCASLLLAVALLVPVTAAAAPVTTSSLLTFDFDNAEGLFDPAPEEQSPRIASATWYRDPGTLLHFAGNPGRALAANQLQSNPRLLLDVHAVPGALLQLKTLHFDLRASSSGPTRWSVLLNDEFADDGDTTTGFATSILELLPAPPRTRHLIAFEFAGTTSDAGTVRIDNVALTGRVSEVGLPASAGLLLPALLALARRRRQPG